MLQSSFNFVRRKSSINFVNNKVLTHSRVLLWYEIQKMGEKETQKYLSSPHPAHHLFYVHYLAFGASQITQLVKNPPATQETPVQFLGWEDPLEKG